MLAPDSSSPDSDDVSSDIKELCVELGGDDSLKEPHALGPLESVSTLKELGSAIDIETLDSCDVGIDIDSGGCIAGLEAKRFWQRLEGTRRLMGSRERSC